MDSSYNEKRHASLNCKLPTYHDWKLRHRLGRKRQIGRGKEITGFSRFVDLEPPKVSPTATKEVQAIQKDPNETKS